MVEEKKVTAYLTLGMILVGTILVFLPESFTYLHTYFNQARISYIVKKPHKHLLKQIQKQTNHLYNKQENRLQHKIDKWIKILDALYQKNQ